MEQKNSDAYQNEDAASVSSLREALANLVNAEALKNVRGLVSCVYRGEPREYEAKIGTNIGALFDLSSAIDAARAALSGVTQPAKPTEISMTEAQIKYMVDRFLSWKLPERFNPDGGISFTKTFNEHTPWPMKHEPYGTNLFNFDEATAMVRHMLEGLSSTEVEKISTDTEVR